MCWQTLFSFLALIIFFVKEATHFLLKTTPALNAILSSVDGGREAGVTRRPVASELQAWPEEKCWKVQATFDICGFVCHTHCLHLKLKSFLNTKVDSLEQCLY